jgi:hypothetical protein
VFGPTFIKVFRYSSVLREIVIEASVLVLVQRMSRRR